MHLAPKPLPQPELEVARQREAGYLALYIDPTVCGVHWGRGMLK